MDAAARHFFGVPPVGLSDDQSALLAAVLPSPRRFDAAAPSDYLQDRRQWILRQMRQLAGMPGVERLLDRDRASDRDACGTLG
jgi:monofunctional biosynthetic peptidoglycan transglycosylase